MLSIEPIGSSQNQVRYYAGLGKEDYYLKGTEPPGVWWGSGADSLHQFGRVRKEAFAQILKGYHPKKRKKLVQNAGESSRRAAFDLTWTPPKSVAVAWSQAELPLRRKIEEACERSLKSAFSVVEDLCGVTRRGKRGTTQESAGLIAAIFRHETARAVPGEIPDPNLHWHMVLCNVSIREDGTTGAIDARPLFRPHMKIALGALFRAKLSKELAKIGLSSYRPRDKRNRTKSWFELDVIPKRLIEEFSKRSGQIKAWLKKKGLSGAKAKERAALGTRQSKEEIKRVDLLGKWQEVAAELGFDASELNQLKSKVVKPACQIEEVIRKAAKTITEQKARFSDIEFLKVAAQEAQCLGFEISEIRAAVESALKTNPELVRLSDKLGEPNFTTKEMLQLEAKLLEVAVGLFENSFHRVSTTLVDKHLELVPSVRSEQAKAVSHITSETNRIACVNGMAGTGKTFMLDVARNVWEENGQHVIGTALAAKAARTLQVASGIKSTHVHALLRDLERGQLTLDSNTVVVLDEAGMIDTRLLLKLVEKIEAAHSKLVMVGDYRQLQAIDAGAPFRAIAEKVGFCHMQEITRQEKKWAKEAVHEMADGKAESALERFAERGLLVIAEDRESAIEELVCDWRASLREDRTSMIFTGTRLETKRINENVSGRVLGLKVY